MLGSHRFTPILALMHVDIIIFSARRRFGERWLFIDIFLERETTMAGTESQ
jgi:hypothetical protein